MKSKDEIKKCELALEDYISSSITMRELGLKHNINRAFLAGFLTARGVDLYSRKSNVNNFIFEKIDSEEKAYWLGFMYADGNIQYDESKNINRIELGLQARDRSHLVKFKNFLQSTRDPKFREKTNSYRVMFSCKNMCEDLIKLGCTPRKSLTLKFPSYNQVPKKLIKHFVRGYFDGDGSISLKENSIIVNISILGTKEFLEQMLIESKINESLKKDSRHENNTFYIKFNTKNGLDFLNWMYNESNIHLDRKANKIKELFNRRNLKINLECRNL